MTRAYPISWAVFKFKIMVKALVSEIGLVDSKTCQHETVRKYQIDHQGENPNHSGVGLLSKYFCLVWIFPEGSNRRFGDPSS